MASEAITRNDLKAILNEVLPPNNDIGRVYTAAWTATSTSENSARVTESITLPAGTYLSYLKIPVCSQETVLAFGIQPVGLAAGGAFAKGQQIMASTFTLSAETTVYGITNMSQATTYTYTDRGFLKCVRIA